MREWYPHSLELGLTLGRFLEDERRFTEAEAHWRALLRDFPTVPDAHLGLGRALEQTGAFAAAQSAYLRARDLDPENPDIYAALVSLARARGGGSTGDPGEPGVLAEPGLLDRYREFAERERTNTVLLDAMAGIEEALGLTEEAAAHRLRAEELRAREEDQNS
ncbi:MAG TPA: tetratricopeptide repeat protein [Spirochaetia bacterium]|nr:tetratricopeptide repeat protein [Spirochaetia bacterium]